jgi:hypothetical protein
MAEIINVTVTDSQELITVSVVDEQELIAAGLSPRGDMQRKVYDTNNNGIVDMSEDTQLFSGNTLASLQTYILNRANHTGEDDIDSSTTGALPLSRIEPINPLTILGNNSGGFGSTPKAMTVTELLALIGAFTFDGSDVEFIQSGDLTIPNNLIIGTPTDNLEIEPGSSATQLKTNGGYLAIKNGQNAFYGLVVRSFGSNSYFANVNAESGFALFSYNNSGSTNALKIDSDGDVYVNDTNLRYSNVIIEGGSTRTLSETDSGKTIRYTSLSGCTVTIPDTLLEGFTCLHVQKGSVQVTFATSGSMTMVNADSHTKTAKLHAVACTLVEATNIVNLNGYTA